MSASENDQLREGLNLQLADQRTTLAEVEAMLSIEHSSELEQVTSLRCSTLTQSSIKLHSE